MVLDRLRAIDQLAANSEGSLNPTVFYDVLPTDHPGCRNDVSVLEEWDRLTRPLSVAPLDGIDRASLEDLSQFLFSVDPGALPPRSARQLADYFARLYVQALSQAVYGHAQSTLQRRIKMLIQRCNFFLRAILDEPLPVPKHAREERLERLCPWDWIDLSAEERLLVLSGSPNLVLETADEAESWTIGLPTQIDLVRPGLWAIGSFYSPGVTFWDGRQMRQRPHDRPIVTVFEFRDRLLALDPHGRLFDLENHHTLHHLRAHRISRARRFGNRLFAMDWTVPHLLHELDLVTREETTLRLAEVFLPNDILQVDSHLYVIDKEQGHIFKYDLQGSLLGVQGAFGRGPGRLFDPIAIRHEVTTDRLVVLNWVPGTLTSSPRF